MDVDFCRILGFSQSTLLKLSLEIEVPMPVISHWLSVSQRNPLLCTSTPSYITVPISTCVLCLILQMDTNNSASIFPLKFLLAHGLLKQPDQNIFGTLKRSKSILLKRQEI